MGFDKDAGQQEDKTSFHLRNAFASNGIIEDPATGAAAATFEGYLRDYAYLKRGAHHIVTGRRYGNALNHFCRYRA